MQRKRVLLLAILLSVLAGSLLYVFLPRILYPLRVDKIPSDAYVVPWMKPNPSARANAGKGSAVLTKVTEIIPKGFEVVEEPKNCRVEDSYLNLKGRRLDPLKTKELKLVLKPTIQGTFSLKPTVLYLDENGKYKSHEPEPVLIVVRELGIRSWLKGER